MNSPTYLVFFHLLDVALGNSDNRLPLIFQMPTPLCRRSVFGEAGKLTLTAVV